MNGIDISSEQEEKLDFLIKFADDLIFEEICLLFEWAENHITNWFDGLFLQEILNLYRASADYTDLDEFSRDDPIGFVTMYNNSVAEENQLIYRMH